VEIGLFFGSFNPIHIGHLIIGDVMASSGEVEQVWYVVSPQNPFKSSKSLIHEFDRLDMVEAAISGCANMKTTDVEFNLPRPNYTVHTLAYLSDKFPQHQFKLIIGEDNLKQFPNWKNHEVILNEYGLLVYPRPRAAPSDLLQKPYVKMIEAPKLDISATFIRQRIEINQSVKFLIPESVMRLIDARGLYLRKIKRS